MGDRSLPTSATAFLRVFWRSLHPRKKGPPGSPRAAYVFARPLHTQPCVFYILFSQPGSKKQMDFYFFISCSESENTTEKQLSAISKSFQVIVLLPHAAAEVWPVLPGECPSCSQGAFPKCITQPCS